ncbi:hypothetical protein DIPPA_18400 [Diplonema papillatum]|nr:hypothetical protein DIPPA_18400 [Diplonema papillatum]
MGAPVEKDKVDVAKVGLSVLVVFLSVWVVVAMLWGADVIGGDSNETIYRETVITRTIEGKGNASSAFSVGPRPMWLIRGMDAGPLRTALEACEGQEIQKHMWNIGHRGAPMQFPEHTVESYTAAAKMGAGIIECDVTFTKDHELVCRHAECDLHTTTNILATSLNDTCTTPFMPANGTFDATARCCASNLTLVEFRSLKGKMDQYNPRANTVEEYLHGYNSRRTEMYESRGTLMTHAESIALFKALDVKMTPELKSGNMPADFSREDFILKAINEYRTASVPGSDVFMQSFLLDDIKYITTPGNANDFADSAVFLTDPVSDGLPADLEQYMRDLVASGIKYIAPAVNALATVNGQALVQTPYAVQAKAAGLKIIGWSWERSAWYYQSVSSLLDTDSKLMHFLHFLAQEVRIVGLFSDWPATTGFYANCML